MPRIIALFLMSIILILPTLAVANDATNQGTFVKKRYTIDGNWSLNTVDGKTIITFSDGFKTKGGPDLKVFLSRKSLDNLSGKTALDNAIKLGVLKSNKGEQSYILPENTDLTEFKSVLIHCEAFSVLWGGFDIMP